MSKYDIRPDNERQNGKQKAKNEKHKTISEKRKAKNKKRVTKSEKQTNFTLLEKIWIYLGLLNIH